MENEILKQMQQTYPGIPADVSEKLAALLETAAGGDAGRRSELLAASGELTGLLSQRFTAWEQAQAQLDEYQQARDTAQQFRQALSQELTARGVPEPFWAAALAVDPLEAEVASSADAVQAAYKAYLQQQSDLKVDQQLRPEQAVLTPKVSPAVENYLRSRRSDSPLAGKLKG